MCVSVCLCLNLYNGECMCVFALMFVQIYILLSVCLSLCLLAYIYMCLCIRSYKIELTLFRVNG